MAGVRLISTPAGPQRGISIENIRNIGIIAHVDAVSSAAELNSRLALTSYFRGKRPPQRQCSTTVALRDTLEVRRILEIQL
jgi:hypothetical protein